MLRFPPLGPAPGLLRSAFPTLPLLAVSGLVAGSLLGGCAWIPGSALDEALNQLGDIDLELSTVPDEWDACVDQYTYSGTVEGRYALEVFDATLSLDDTVLASERVSASNAEDGKAGITIAFDPVVGLPLAGGALTLTVTLEHAEGASESDTFEIQLTPAPTRFEDGDGDGSGGDSILTCDASQGVATGGDCDDEDTERTPGADELCDGIDNDCDGIVPEIELDGDGDGFAGCQTLSDGTIVVDDCDDTNADVNPDEVEEGPDEADNGIDEDCDGFELCFADTDGDGFAATVPGIQVDLSIYTDCADAIGTLDVSPPPLPGETDCDDTETPLVGNGVTYPGAPELCDGLDNDCDGMPGPLEQDGDSDGWLQCAVDPLAPDAIDCDDTNPAINPDAPEICDGLDNDCDPATPVGSELDDDTDLAFVCSTIPLLLGPQDCDDDDPLRSPGSPEVCDGIDNDCDEVIPPAELIDVDGDGSLSCDDCNDDDASVSPSSTEQINDLDDNCDGLWDCYVDTDLDGFGETGGEVAPNQDMPCSQIPGVSPQGGDCDDGDEDIYTGAPELCDGLDNDCDGATPDDENDSDGDSFVACTDYVGADALDGGDCGPDAPQVYPGAPELCTALDEDCDGDPYAHALRIGITPDADPDETEGFNAFPDGWTTSESATIEVCGPEQEMTARRITLESPVTIVGRTSDASLGVSFLIDSTSVTFREVVLSPFDYADTLDGGVIRHTGTGVLTVEDTLIECAMTSPISDPACPAPAAGGDLPGSGGAIRSPDLVMTNAQVSNCWSSGSGGALLVEGQAVLTDVELVGNLTNGSGGAIAVEIGAGLNILDSRIEGNVAGSSGGAILLDEGAILSVQSTPGVDGILDNEACFNGGGIAALDDNDVTLQGVDIVGNRASTRGGGLYMAEGSTLTVIDTLFELNAVSAMVAVPDPTDLDDGDGGGAWVSMFDGEDATFMDSVFRGNSSNRGGGLAAETSQFGTIFIESTAFTANHEAALYLSAGNGRADVRDVLFDRNWTELAEGSASALHSRLDTVLLDSTGPPGTGVRFVGNAATDTSTTTSGLLNISTDDDQSFCACDVDLGVISLQPWPNPGPPDENSGETNYGLPVADGTAQPFSGTIDLYCSAGTCTGQDNQCNAVPYPTASCVDPN